MCAFIDRDGSYLAPGSSVRSRCRAQPHLLGCDDVARLGQASTVDQPLGLAECSAVKGGDPAGKSVDVVVEFGVRQRAVDPTVEFRGAGPEIVTADDDLECPRAAGEQWQTFDRAASRQHASPDLGLTEDRILEAREPHVASECQFGAAASCPAPDEGD